MLVTCNHSTHRPPMLKEVERAQICLRQCKHVFYKGTKIGSHYKEGTLFEDIVGGIHCGKLIVTYTKATHIA